MERGRNPEITPESEYLLEDLLNDAQLTAEICGGPDYRDELSDSVEDVHRLREPGTLTFQRVHLSVERSRPEPGLPVDDLEYTIISILREELEASALPAPVLLKAKEVLSSMEQETDEKWLQCFYFVETRCAFDTDGHNSDFLLETFAHYEVDGIKLCFTEDGVEAFDDSDDDDDSDDVGDNDEEVAEGLISDTDDTFDDAFDELTKALDRTMESSELLQARNFLAVLRSKYIKEEPAATSDHAYRQAPIDGA